MEDVIALMKEKAVELERNPLIADWLESSDVDAKKKLFFTLPAVSFLMGFRDFNLYYVKYDTAKNELELALNAHAEEDETHSRLLHHDWPKVGLEEELGWTPRELLWFLTGDATEELRRLDFRLTRLVHQTKDPLLRFAVVEAVEETGAVLFPRTVAVANAIVAREPDRAPFLYFGQHHLDLENGHLQNNADEGLFLAAPLTPQQQEQAVALVDEVFDIIWLLFAAWEKMARAVSEKRWDYIPGAAGREAARAGLRDLAPSNLSVYMQLDYPASPVLGPGPALDLNVGLAQIRSEAFQELWSSPFCSWVRDANAWGGDFRGLLRLVLLPWILEAWAGADFFLLDMEYEQDKLAADLTPIQRGINRLAALYTAEHSRRLVEWELLELDEHTGWTLGQTLRFYFLDPEVEQHRAVSSKLRKLALRFPSPLHRYWILKCVVRFEDALIRSLGVAMRHARVPEADENFIAMAGHPERLHPDLAPDPDADRAVQELELLPLDRADFDIIRDHIILGIKDLEACRLDLSWRSIVEEKRYQSFPTAAPHQVEQVKIHHQLQLPPATPVFA